MRFFGCVLVLCIFGISTTFVAAAKLPDDDLFRLDIIHYNDFHDRFEETSLAYPICATNDTQCIGGFARFYYEIRALLKQKPDALLLNAGDTFQGTYWYTLLKWNVTQKFINMLPNDAHAIGNHEFDGGVAGLAPYLAALKAPVLAANMDTSAEPSLNGLFKSHIIVERKKRKIGIIGLITPDTKTSSNSEGVIFLDPIETVQKEAKLLTEKGIDIIIVLSHCGLEVDMEMAKKVGQHIDIIVGGHSHSLLWTGIPPSDEIVAGPYPVVISPENNPHHMVLVVTASAFTKYLGNLTTYFDKSGELRGFEGDPVFLNRSIPEDPEMKALLQPYKELLHAMVNEVLGTTDKDLKVTQCGSKECEIGDLIADAFLNITKEKIVTDLPQVAFILRNMIRGSIPKGDIIKGAVINTLPFTNKVIAFPLAGRQLMLAFEWSMKSHWELNPFIGPWIPHISGMKLKMNVTEGKVESLLVKEGDEYIPLDLTKEYQVTTLQFLFDGGNGFTMLNNDQNVTEIGIDTEIFEEYIKKITPISPTLDERLIVLN